MLVALVGQPNSGKSALLSRLTGARVVTSNYPGTTVELASGRIPGSDIEVLDTPGIYSLAASSREQQITREVLEKRAPDLVVDVVDGTNLARHLSLTLALIRYGGPVIIAVNCADRLRAAGLEVDTRALSGRTGAPVVATSAITGEGVGELRAEIQAIRHTLGTGREGKPGRLSGPGSGAGQEVTGWPESLQALQKEASSIAAAVLSRGGNGSKRERPRLAFAERLEAGLDRPLITFLVLGAGLFAAWAFISRALPFAEATVRLLLDPVGAYLRPFLSAALPPGPISDTIARAVPEGVILPLCTVLPAMVLTYSLIAFLEDTGLLCRYAALGDALTGALNLPGQALIPFMLGFGCRVPAILSARILPSQESRRNASILIAALVPCTATVSLAWTTLARFRGNPLVPVVAVAASALGLARLLNLTSGTGKDPLVLELPPLRMPAARNLAMKTRMRLSGFFTHVLPLVVAMNVGVRLFMDRGVAPLSGALSGFAADVLGIPPEALLGALLTMLQRYLAPLFLLQLPLSPREATIAVTMVSLGFPCLPSAVALWRELGPKVVLVTFAISTCLSLGWGTLLNLVLP
jgi:ferrous iron transport protein B